VIIVIIDHWLYPIISLSFSLTHHFIFDTCHMWIVHFLFLRWLGFNFILLRRFSVLRIVLISS